MKQDKKLWMSQLKVGDIVCDCRFKHLAIKKITPYKIARMPHWLCRVVFADLMPSFIGNTFSRFYFWINRKIGNVELVDQDLILEDGTSCNAIHCRDPIDHSIDEHTKRNNNV